MDVQGVVVPKGSRISLRGISKPKQEHEIRPLNGACAVGKPVLLYTCGVFSLELGECKHGLLGLCVYFSPETETKADMASIDSK